MSTRQPDDRLRKLLTDPLRAPIVAALQPATCYLVGGAVRDWLVLRRPSPDWDLIVTADADQAAERLANRLGGRTVALGGDRFATFRVTLTSGGARGRVIDVCDPGDRSLEQELLRRDLTLNSIAVDLSTAEILDPAGGRDDIRARTLRANAPERFVEDPVRTLRLIRLWLNLPGFSVDPATTESARSGSAALTTVAGERVRAELDKLLGQQPRLPLGEVLADHALFPRLWGSAAVTPDVPTAGAPDLESAHEADRRLAAVVEAGADEPSPGWLVAMHHTLLIRAAAGSSAVERLDQMRVRGWISRTTADRIGQLLEVAQLPDSEAGQRLFIDRFGDHWLVAAVAASVLGEQGVRALAELVALERLEGASIRRLRPLLGGDALADDFGLEPGPRMGAILRSLHEAQVTGEVETESEARKWVSSRLERDPT